MDKPLDTGVCYVRSRSGAIYGSRCAVGKSGGLIDECRYCFSFWTGHFTSSTV
jgi:hypothetical protein